MDRKPTIAWITVIFICRRCTCRLGDLEKVGILQGFQQGLELRYMHEPGQQAIQIVRVSVDAFQR